MMPARCAFAETPHIPRPIWGSVACVTQCSARHGLPQAGVLRPSYPQQPQQLQQQPGSQKAAELEAARSEAQSQLLQELDALRRHKAMAEEQRRRLELQVCVFFSSPVLAGFFIIIFCSQTCVFGSLRFCKACGSLRTQLWG